MPQLSYGVWDGVVYDNRSGQSANPPMLDLSDFDNFNKDNPARIFLSHRGFLVFDEKAPLLWALWKHFEKVASESCGKCSPCRSGTPLLRDALAAACRGEAVDRGRFLEIAE